MILDKNHYCNIPKQPDRLIPEELPPIAKVMEYAKWVPAGDNILPYRFEYLSETKCVVHGKDTRDFVIYDLQGNASKVGIGAMLAAAEIAATCLGYNLISSRIGEQNCDHNPKFLLELNKHQFESYP